MNTPSLLQIENWDDVYPVIRTDLHKTSQWISVDAACVKAYNLFCEELHLHESIYTKISDILCAMSGESGLVELFELLYFFQNLFFAVRENDFTILNQQRGLAVNKVVDIEEFVKSREYMNQKRFIRKRVMDELISLFERENYVEIVLAGAIGWGKTFAAHIGIAYMLYSLSCYHSPQLEFGLAPGSTIVLICQSRTLELAKKVAFGELGNMLREAPYFSKTFLFDKNRRSEMLFPKSITVMPIAATDTSALGMNVWGGIQDEMNFMNVVTGGVHTKLTGKEEYDQAQQLYNTVIRRMKSRYHVQGKIPGKLFLVSSANYPNSFTDRKMAEAAEEIVKSGETTIFVVKMAQWESLPPGKISAERFLVEVGNELKASKIVKTRDEAIDPADVIEVPVDYKSDFERDLEGALRDIAGISVGAGNVFIKQREQIVKAVKAHELMFDGNQLFTVDQVNLNYYSDNLNELINFKFLEYIMNQDLVFAAHTDLALTGDTCGLAVACTLGYKKLGKRWAWQEAAGRMVEVPPSEFPVVCVVGALDIVPPPNQEIDLMQVAELCAILALKINLRYTTADQYQSAAILQALRKRKNITGKGLRTGLLSVDATMAPYCMLKEAIRDECILLPNNPVLLKELRELELDVKHKKVDHPEGGGKDLSDSVCGANYLLSIRSSRSLREREVTEAEDGRMKIERIDRRGGTHERRRRR
jgi:hypothetical protein